MDASVVVNGHQNVGLGVVGVLHPVVQGHLPLAGGVVGAGSAAVVGRQQGLDLVRDSAIQCPLPGLVGVNTFETPLAGRAKIVPSVNTNQHNFPSFFPPL